MPGSLTTSARRAAQLAGQLAQRIDLAGPEDDPRARLEVERNHAGFTQRWAIARRSRQAACESATELRGFGIAAHLYAFIAVASGQPFLAAIDRPGAEQELDDVAFVRLQPVELDRRHGPRFRRSMCIASISCAAKLRVFGDRRADQRRADRLEHLRLAGTRRRVTNGNMYSFFAIAGSGDSQCTTVGSR